jgi:septal ring factor EnvC (AmiA/AmiB activator)
MLGAMKRQLLFLLVASLALVSRVQAEDTPASAAERQEAEERYKRMSADIEDLKTALASHQQRLTEQREEIRRLTDELARANANKDFATKDDFRHLAEKIKEVDEKRLAEDAKVAEKLEKLAKMFSQPTKPIASAPAPKVSPEPKSATEKGYEYTVRAGDSNLNVIIQALAKQGTKVTMRQVMDANPSVNWNKLRIGQKLFIPAQP